MMLFLLCFYYRWVLFVYFSIFADPLAMQTEKLKGMIVGQNSQEQQTIENRGLGDLRSDEIEISIEMIGLIVGQMTDLIGFNSVYIANLFDKSKGCRGCDRMVVGYITANLANSAYPLTL